MPDDFENEDAQQRRHAERNRAQNEADESRLRRIVREEAERAAETVVLRVLETLGMDATTTAARQAWAGRMGFLTGLHEASKLRRTEVSKIPASVLGGVATALLGAALTYILLHGVGR